MGIDHDWVGLDGDAHLGYVHLVGLGLEHGTHLGRHLAAETASEQQTGHFLIYLQTELLGGLAGEGSDAYVGLEDVFPVVVGAAAGVQLVQDGLGRGFLRVDLDSVGSVDLLVDTLVDTLVADLASEFIGADHPDARGSIVCFLSGVLAHALTFEVGLCGGCSGDLLAAVLGVLDHLVEGGLAVLEHLGQLA